MIICVSCVGILLLFYIQFRLYRMEQHQGLKHFIKSKELLEILREGLLVILSVTLALNFTSYIEAKQTKYKVIRMLDGVSLEIQGECSLSRMLKYDYETGIIDAEELALSLSHNTEFSENMLKNDIVITVMSPTTYSEISVKINDINRIHDAIISGRISNDGIVKWLEIIESLCEDIHDAIDVEKLYLQGKLSEEDL